MGYTTMGYTTRVVCLGVLGVLAGPGASGQTCATIDCNCCCWDSVQGMPTTLSEGRPACLAAQLGLLPCCNPGELTTASPGADTTAMTTSSTSSSTSTELTTSTVEPTPEVADTTTVSILTDSTLNPVPATLGSTAAAVGGTVSTDGGEMTDSVDRVDAGAGQDRLPGTQVDFFLKGDAPGDKAGGKAGGRAGGKAGKGTRPPTNSPTRAPNAPMHSPTSAPTRSPGGKKAGKKSAGAKVGKMDGTAYLASAGSMVDSSESSSTTATVLVMIAAVAGLGFFAHRRRKMEGYTDTRQPLLGGYDMQIAAPGTAPHEPRFSVLNTYTVRAEAAAHGGYTKRRSPERSAITIMTMA